MSTVATDILGLTGRNIIQALLAGETSPDRLSWKVRGRLREKEKEVRRAMVSNFNDFHRQMLAILWKQYEFQSSQIEEGEPYTRTAVEPYRGLLEL